MARARAPATPPFASVPAGRLERHLDLLRELLAAYRHVAELEAELEDLVAGERPRRSRPPRIQAGLPPADEEGSTVVGGEPAAALAEVPPAESPPAKVPRPRRRYRCSRCHQAGHRGPACPSWPPPFLADHAQSSYDAAGTGEPPPREVAITQELAPLEPAGPDHHVGWDGRGVGPDRVAELRAQVAAGTYDPKARWRARFLA